jgi:large subunit ribosomal protein L17
MVTSLFEHESIRTTEIKAKAARPLAEKMITLAKQGDMHSRRLAMAVLTKKSVTHKLFTDIRERFMDRAGGYTSIVRIGPRHGDAAEMAVLELIKPADREKKAARKKTRRKKTSAKKKAAEAAPLKEEAPAPKSEKPAVQAAEVAEKAPEVEISEEKPEEKLEEKPEEKPES